MRPQQSMRMPRLGNRAYSSDQLTPEGCWFRPPPWNGRWPGASTLLFGHTVSHLPDCLHATSTALTYAVASVGSQRPLRSCLAVEPDIDIPLHGGKGETAFAPPLPISSLTLSTARPALLVSRVRRGAGYAQHSIACRMHHGSRVETGIPSPHSPARESPPNSGSATSSPTTRGEFAASVSVFPLHHSGNK